MKSSASRGALGLAFTTIYLVWGSTYLGIRVAVETLPPFAMAGARFIIAGAFLFAALRLAGFPWPTRRQWLDCSVIGIFLLVGGNGLVSWAEKSVPSGIAALLVSLGPIFTVLLEWVWPGGQRPTVLTFAGLGCGILGVTWLMAPWETLHASEHIDPAGAVALLGACFLWSVGSIYSRRAQALPRPLLSAAVQMLVGGLALAVVALLRGEWQTLDWSKVSADSLWAFGYLVVMGSLVGFSTFAWLMEHSTPALVSTYAYVNPAVAVVLGWLILNEPLSSRLGIASVGIILSVILVTLGRRPAVKPGTAPTAGRPDPQKT